jgi:acetylornithine deacetylase/succinyl-diaminopimelate desuccinylase-like protein
MHRGRFIRELMHFVRFPSISAQPRHAMDVRNCADWLTQHLRDIGLDARILRTPGHPIVHATARRRANLPTVLVYGHYDVQPVEPLDRWESPPFEPVIRADYLRARGASDDEGQMWAHIKAIECLLRARPTLPVNVTCLFEGEEEIGSRHLIAWLERNANHLVADVAVLSDMRMRSAAVPALTYGLRGALNLELEVRGPAKDLHSGLFGGSVHNPIQALCEILARLHDRDGRIAIPGFYDDVRGPEPGELARLRRMGPTDAETRHAAGVTRGWGERGYTLYERTVLRPALTLNGIYGGHTGPGHKSVIPASAFARVGFRLVPDQHPATIERLFRAHVAQLTPETVKSVVRGGFGALPALMGPRHPVLDAARSALRKSFSEEPALLRSGGTIPVVNSLLESLGIPVVLMGFAHPDDGAHAPNERFHIPTLHRAIEASIRFLSSLPRGLEGAESLA